MSTFNRLPRTPFRKRPSKVRTPYGVKMGRHIRQQFPSLSALYDAIEEDYRETEAHADEFIRLKNGVRRTLPF